MAGRCVLSELRGRLCLNDHTRWMTDDATFLDYIPAVTVRISSSGGPDNYGDKWEP
jgi:hypothetical protein